MEERLNNAYATDSDGNIICRCKVNELARIGSIKDVATINGIKRVYYYSHKTDKQIGFAYI